jgi:hypothetical protein
LTTDEVVRPDIAGGSCLILPVHLCTLWAAQQTHEISFNAFKVWFAAQEVKFWRAKATPGQPYRYQPKAFRPEDMGRILSGMSERAQRQAFTELEDAHLLSLSEAGIAFIEETRDLNLSDAVKQRARAMFEQLHRDTRDKPIAFPRRCLVMIARLGKQIVRAATLLGLLLRTMLHKRTPRYGGYRGCTKAAWIANVFGVAVRGVRGERQKLIEEGCFVQDRPTPVHIQKRYGLWLRLNLQTTPDAEAAPLSQPEAPELAPQHPQNQAQLAPLLNPSLPSLEGNLNNQYLTEPTPGVSNRPTNPSWNHITKDDLIQPERRNALFYDVVQLGILCDSEPGRLTFFAAIAKTLRLKTIISNLGGFLRKLVETPAYHAHIAQVDEDTALGWLRHAHVHETSGFPLVTRTHGELSRDALTVRELKRDLERAVVHLPAGETLLHQVQRYGYLCDWSQERWEQAEMELAQSRVWPRAP